MCYDRIALNLAIASFIPPICYISFITAPAAIYVTIRYWNSPGSLLGTSRTQFIIALLIAIFTILLMITGIIFLIFALWINPHASPH